MCITSCLFLTQNANAIAENLQGQVEDTSVEPSTSTPIYKSSVLFPVPVLPQPHLKKETGQSDSLNNNNLQGTETQNQLNGDARQNSNYGGQMEKPFSGPTTLRGAANYADLKTNKDPDVGDKELQIKWDLWRNRFLWQVQANMQRQSTNPNETMMHWDPTLQKVVAGFPVGLTSWFACEVTNQGQIIHLKILHSSGIPYFDKAVLRAVWAMQGTPILRFPSESRRTIVTMAAGVKSVSHVQPRQYYHFGDVEQYSVPDNNNNNGSGWGGVAR